MKFPQLRVRTEFSFRKAYGPMKGVAKRLKAIGAPAAGIVDSKGTWGHVQWEKALSKEGIAPLFGAECPVEVGDKKPVAWVLAKDLRQFYRFMSANDFTPESFKAAKGVIRFAGAALTDPQCFDYIDLNPRSITQQRAAVRLHQKTGKPMVLTSDNDFPAPSDFERFLAWDDSKKMTPQWLLEYEEFRALFPTLSDRQFADAVANTFMIADELSGQTLSVAPIISVEGDLNALVEEGKAARLASGKIPEWTSDYTARVEREMEMIFHKKYESYFIVVADLVSWAKTKMLVGPARGSSAGSLVCFLLGITEVDPLVHGLLFERFIDVNRDDLPDIDIDFNDKKRYMVFDYLCEKYGIENVAKIGNVQRLQPRSVMAHGGKKLGIPAGASFPVLDVLIEHSSGDARYGSGLEDTLKETPSGREFIEKYPEAEVITHLENHASHTGVHAAGIIVCNEPVIEYCTVIDGIAQIDKKDAEYLNLLKIDALGLRTLGVIEDAACISNADLYNLTFDDPSVLSIFDQGKFSGIFQFEGAAQRQVSIQVPMSDFKKIDHVTALARPGPLGGGAAHWYIERNAGNAPIEYKHPSMAAYLGETMGVVLYQEQVMRIVREIGAFSWEETSAIRKAMSRRKGEEFFNKRGEKFVEGAAKLGVNEDTALQIWDEICSFGTWGMNKSHTVSYAMISYWCAYMKCYHPVDYAAACLRSAKDDEQTVEILRELNQEGVGYVPFNPLLSEVNWAAKDGEIIGGFSNLIGIGPVKAAALLEERSSGGLSEATLEKLSKMKVKHEDLYPAKRLWSDIYDNPDEYNIHGGVKEFAELRDGENGVVICRLIKKERRDDNEQALVARRGGERRTGQTLFLDLHVVDDSVAKPIRARLRPQLWDELGSVLAEKAVDNQDWFLIRGRWLKQFSMMIVKKIKCLTNEGIFNE